MVTDGHDIIADDIHELGFDIALIGRVHQAALILVARIDNDDILACQFLAQGVDLGDDACDAAKAFTGGIRLGVAGGIKRADRLDPAVQVIGMDDMQRVIGRSRARD